RAIGDAPRLGAQDAEEGVGVHRPGAHLEIIRLLENGSLSSPVAGERENQVLKRGHGADPSATARKRDERKGASAELPSAAVVILPRPDSAEEAIPSVRSPGGRRRIAVRA